MSPIPSAQALAWRLNNEAPSDFDGRLDYAYRLCFGRSASPAERRRLEAYYRSQPADYAWTGISRILLNTHEFITRE
jgi:hypothetical protein